MLKLSRLSSKAQALRLLLSNKLLSNSFTNALKDSSKNDGSFLYVNFLEKARNFWGVNRVDF